MAQRARAMGIPKVTRPAMRNCEEGRTSCKQGRHKRLAVQYQCLLVDDDGGTYRVLRSRVLVLTGVLEVLGVGEKVA